MSRRTSARPFDLEESAPRAARPSFPDRQSRKRSTQAGMGRSERFVTRLFD